MIKVQAIRARREYRVGDKYHGLPITEITKKNFGSWYVVCKSEDGRLHDQLILKGNEWEVVSTLPEEQE